VLGPVLATAFCGHSHGDLGDLPNFKLREAVLSGHAREAQRVGVVFDDSPCDPLCCRCSGESDITYAAVRARRQPSPSTVQPGTFT
jgi:hypothetical protein